jgi:hypothetical protein
MKLIITKHGQRPAGDDEWISPTLTGSGNSPWAWFRRRRADLWDYLKALYESYKS